MEGEHTGCLSVCCRAPHQPGVGLLPLPAASEVRSSSETSIVAGESGGFGDEDI